MNTSRLFIFAAVVLFVLAGLLLILDAGDKDLPVILAYFGLGAFAAGHMT